MKRISVEGFSCVGVSFSGFRGLHSMAAGICYSIMREALRIPASLAGTSIEIVEEEV